MRRYYARALAAACFLACILAVACFVPHATDLVPSEGSDGVQEAQETPVSSSASDANVHVADKSTSNAKKNGVVSGVVSPNEKGTNERGTEPDAADPHDADLFEPEEDVSVPEADDEAKGSESEESGPVADAPVFVMPEGAEYESQTVLVNLGEGVDLQQASETLSGVMGNGNVELQEVTGDCVRVTFDGGASVEEAVNQLLETGVVKDAQPNYVYHVLSEPMPVGPEAGSAGPEAGNAGPEASEIDAEPVAPADPAEPADSAEPVEPAEPGEEPAESEELERAAMEEAAEANAWEAAQAEAPEAETPEAEAPEAGAPTDGEDEHAEKSRGEAGVSAASDEAKATAEKNGEAGLESLSAKVNDPCASTQWYLNSIKAYDAWSYAKCNRKVTVACMDLGFDLNHQDLKANMVEPYNAHNAVHGGSVSDVTPYKTSVDHGSHVAGVVGGVANNRVGIAGVAYNANIMPIKVVDGSGRAYTDDLVKAYEYVISHKSTHNVRVVNLSMGADVRNLSGTGMSLSKDDKVLTRIREAYAAGIVTVAAAGNANSSKDSQVPYSCYPAEDGKVVSVINLVHSGSSVGRFASSNYNLSGQSTKNISAPGTDILSTVYGNKYESNTGTSMAAPVVSGVLALEFAARPSLTADEAITLLYATAKNLGGSEWTREYGWGEVNALAAAKAARDGMTSVQKTKADKVTNLADAVAVGEVQEGIAALPAVSSLRVAHASQVSAARAAYNALTASQRKKVSNYNKLVEAEKRIKELVQDDNVAKGLAYRTHVQREGWQAWVTNGATSGTVGRSLRLEGIEIKLNSKPYSGTIQYRTHVQSIGWESSWRSAGQTSGTMGRSKRLEAIQIRLTGEMATHYDVWYRVHAQQFGWLGWAKNGDSAGTAGYSYRLEGIQVEVRPKNSGAHAVTGAFRYGVHYRTHVQRKGWQPYVHDGSTSGSTGLGLRLEGININVNGSPYSGGIQYATHVQSIGWQGWRSNGQMSGTSGQGKRLEAIRIKLTGDLAKHYDVYYRVHAQHFGWMGWAKNGSNAGTQGYSYRLEAIQIRLVAKGGYAPGSTADAFRKR